jgi:hypothetical protein
LEWSGWRLGTPDNRPCATICRSCSGAATPDMRFIFNLAVGLPIAITAVLLITLNHYE